MRVINARNVHLALPQALDLLKWAGVPRDSRNGPTKVFPEPVTTVYHRPEERVMFWPERDANPFFHFFEALWMLGGRNDVEYLAQFVDRMRSFSDDGVTFHGAYGHRWVNHFERDQLGIIISALKRNPDDRRNVLSMWDANVDLGREGKDLPCNLQAIFRINTAGRLDMTVTNRSNDMVWGAYGANAVHFSFLHEYVARGIGVGVGVYRQMSNDLHAYLSTLEPVECLADHAQLYVPDDALCPYTRGEVEPFPLIRDWERWNAELGMFLSDPHAMGFTEPFFKKVAVPMYLAHEAYKVNRGEDRYTVALAALEACAATDWKRAGEEWLTRRLLAFKERLARARDDGPAYG